MLVSGVGAQMKALAALLATLCSIHLLRHPLLNRISIGKLRAQLIEQRRIKRKKRIIQKMNPLKYMTRQDKEG